MKVSDVSVQQTTQEILARLRNQMTETEKRLAQLETGISDVTDFPLKRKMKDTTKAQPRTRPVKQSSTDFFSILESDNGTMLVQEFATYYVDGVEYQHMFKPRCVIVKPQPKQLPNEIFYTLNDNDRKLTTDAYLAKLPKSPKRERKVYSPRHPRKFVPEDKPQCCMPASELTPNEDEVDCITEELLQDYMPIKRTRPTPTVEPEVVEDPKEAWNNHSHAPAQIVRYVPSSEPDQTILHEFTEDDISPTKVILKKTTSMRVKGSLVELTDAQVKRQMPSWARKWFTPTLKPVCEQKVNGRKVTKCQLVNEKYYHVKSADSLYRDDVGKKYGQYDHLPELIKRVVAEPKPEVTCDTVEDFVEGEVFKHDLSPKSEEVVRNFYTRKVGKLHRIRPRAPEEGANFIKAVASREPEYSAIQDHDYEEWRNVFKHADFESRVYREEEFFDIAPFKLATIPGDTVPVFSWDNYLEYHYRDNDHHPEHHLAPMNTLCSLHCVTDVYVSLLGAMPVPAARTLLGSLMLSPKFSKVEDGVKLAAFLAELPVEAFDKNARSWRTDDDLHKQTRTCLGVPEEMSIKDWINSHQDNGKWHKHFMWKIAYSPLGIACRREITAHIMAVEATMKAVHQIDIKHDKDKLSASMFMAYFLQWAFPVMQQGFFSGVKEALSDAKGMVYTARLLKGKYKDLKQIVSHPFEYMKRYLSMNGSIDLGVSLILHLYKIMTAETWAQTVLEVVHAMASAGIMTTSFQFVLAFIFGGIGVRDTDATGRPPPADIITVSRPTASTAIPLGTTVSIEETPRAGIFNRMKNRFKKLIKGEPKPDDSVPTCALQPPRHNQPGPSQPTPSTSTPKPTPLPPAPTPSSGLDRLREEIRSEEKNKDALKQRRRQETEALLNVMGECAEMIDHHVEDGQTFTEIEDITDWTTFFDNVNARIFNFGERIRTHPNAEDIPRLRASYAEAVRQSGILYKTFTIYRKSDPGTIPNVLKPELAEDIEVAPPASYPSMPTANLSPVPEHEPSPSPPPSVRPKRKKASEVKKMAKDVAGIFTGLRDVASSIVDDVRKATTSSPPPTEINILQPSIDMKALEAALYERETQGLNACSTRPQLNFSSSLFQAHAHTPGELRAHSHPKYPVVPITEDAAIARATTFILSRREEIEVETRSATRWLVHGVPTVQQTHVSRLAVDLDAKHCSKDILVKTTSGEERTVTMLVIHKPCGLALRFQKFDPVHFLMILKDRNQKAQTDYLLACFYDEFNHVCLLPNMADPTKTANDDEIWTPSPPEPVPEPEPVMEEGFSTIDLVVKAMFAIVGLTVCKGLVSTETFNFWSREGKANIKALNDSFNISKNVASILQHLGAILRSMFVFFTKKTGEWSFWGTRQVVADVEQWRQRVMEVTSPGNLVDIGINKTKRDQIFNLGLESEKIYMRALSDKVDAPILNAIRSICDEVRKLVDKCTNMELAMGTRYTPFSIQVYGSPGVGKSTMINSVVNDLAIATHISPDIYAVNIGCKHWDGYKGQKFIKFDDLITERHDLENLKQFMSVNSNDEYIPPRASLEDKGQRVEPWCVVSCSNVPYPEDDLLVDPVAYQRRRHKLIGVKVRKEFLKNRNGDQSPSNIDWDKIRETEKDTDRFPHLVMRYSNPVGNNDSVEIQSGGWMNFEKMATDLTRLFKQHIDREEKIKTTRSRPRPLNPEYEVNIQQAAEVGYAKELSMYGSVTLSHFVSRHPRAYDDTILEAIRLFWMRVYEQQNIILDEIDDCTFSVVPHGWQNFAQYTLTLLNDLSKTNEVAFEDYKSAARRNFPVSFLAAPEFSFPGFVNARAFVVNNGPINHFSHIYHWFVDPEFIAVNYKPFFKPFSKFNIKLRSDLVNTLSPAPRANYRLHKPSNERLTLRTFDHGDAAWCMHYWRRDHLGFNRPWIRTKNGHAISHLICLFACDPQLMRKHWKELQSFEYVEHLPENIRKQYYDFIADARSRCSVELEYDGDFPDDDRRLMMQIINMIAPYMGVVQAAIPAQMVTPDEYSPGVFEKIACNIRSIGRFLYNILCLDTNAFFQWYASVPWWMAILVYISGVVGAVLAFGAVVDILSMLWTNRQEISAAVVEKAQVITTSATTKLALIGNSVYKKIYSTDKPTKEQLDEKAEEARTEIGILHLEQAKKILDPEGSGYGGNKNTHSNPIIIRAQGSNDLSRLETERLVFSHTYPFECMTRDRGASHGYMIAIRGRHFLTNAHLVRGDVSYVKVYDLPGSPIVDGRPTLTIWSQNISVLPNKKRDIAFLEFTDPRVPCSRDMTPHFCPTSYSYRHDQCEATSLSVSAPHYLIGAPRAFQDFPSHAVSSVEVTSLLEEVNVIEHAFTSNLSAAGLCGAPYVRTSGESDGRIFAIHGAARFGVPVYREDVIDYVKGIPTGNWTAVAEAAYRAPAEGATTKPLPDYVDFENRVFQLGSIPTPTANTKTRLHQTPWFEQILPNEVAPAVLNTWDSRNQSKFDPILLNLTRKTVSAPPEPFNEDDRLEFESGVKQIIVSYGYDMEPRPLSFEEAIVGVDGVPEIQRMNLNTSPGYPYTLDRPTNGKRSYLTMGDTPDCPLLEISEVLESALLARLLEASQGKKTRTFWTLFPKDETRPLDKIANVKTRVVSVPPMDYTILWRAFNAHWIRFWYLFRQYLPNKIGVNMDSMEATDLAAYLAQVRCDGKLLDTLISAEDAQTYDGSHVDHVSYTKCKNFFYQVHSGQYPESELPTDYSIVEDDRLSWLSKSWCPVHDTIRNTLDEELVGQHVVYADWVFWVVFGMGSGHPATGDFNGFKRWQIVFGAYCKAMRENGFPLLARFHHFVTWVRQCNFGDDHLRSNAKLLDSMFTPTAVVAFAKTLGYTFTSDVKDQEADELRPLGQCTFLSRSFTYMKENPNIILCPLKEISIAGLCNWFRESKYVPQRIQQIRNLEDAARFAFSYGKDYYDRFCFRALRIVAQHGYVAPVFPTYEAARDLFFAGL